MDTWTRKAQVSFVKVDQWSQDPYEPCVLSWTGFCLQMDQQIFDACVTLVHDLGKLSYLTVGISLPSQRMLLTSLKTHVLPTDIYCRKHTMEQ